MDPTVGGLAVYFGLENGCVGVAVPKMGDMMDVTKEGLAEADWGQFVSNQPVVDTSFGT